MKMIKDALYGFIKLEKKFLRIVDHPEFQRLRWIRQLGLNQLVYPSAMHTRFEHSIGSFHLAKRLCEHLDIESDEFKAAALLHDIGHMPLSHATEQLARTHEEISIEVIKNSVAGVLEKEGMNVNLICELIKGKGKLGKLISGEIDVDRLDYLKRDAYYTGVAYGVIDTEAIIRGIKKIGKHIWIRQDYLPACESLLIGRYLMYGTVYLHHTVRCVNSMIRRACQEMMIRREINIERLTDFELMNLLMKDEHSRQIFERILRRNLYKEILRIPWKLKVSSIEEIYEIENSIADYLGVRNGEILLNIPHIPKFLESKVIISGLEKSLEEVSPLVKALNNALENYFWVGVYACKPIKKNKVRKIIERFI